MGSYLVPVFAALVAAIATALVAKYRHPTERDNTLANTAHQLSATLEDVATELRRTQHQLREALDRIDELHGIVEGYREKIADYESRWADLLDS
jgi:ABC-type transporter Mla subunit MlaD